MRRLARLLFKCCSIASIIMLVAVCAVWMRSRAYRDSWEKHVVIPTTPDRGETIDWHLISDCGSLRCYRTRGGATARYFQGKVAEDEPIAPIVGTDISRWTLGEKAQYVDLFEPRWAFEHSSTGLQIYAAGFRFIIERAGANGDRLWEFHCNTRIPYWMLAIVFTAPLMLRIPLAIQRRRRRKRIADQICTRCGYDLRASSDKCPECGSAVPA